MTMHAPAMPHPARMSLTGWLMTPMSLLSLLATGAIFGFFYAWVCSTMWGLDATDPRVAIKAMQAMNASVRNPVFFPAFFLTPVVLAATAAVAALHGSKRSALLFAASAALYFGGAFLVTATINVPMNEALGLATVPTDVAEAQAMWDAYSAPWQFWNTLRTVVSGACLLLTGLAIALLNKGDS